MQQDFVPLGERRAPAAHGDAASPLLAEADAEIRLIEQALRHGRTAVVAGAAARLARASLWAGAEHAATVAADLEVRARAGDVTIAAHLLASIEEALAQAAAARTPTPHAALAPPATAPCPQHPPAPHAPAAAAIAVDAAPGAIGGRPSITLAAAAVGFAGLIARSFSPSHVSATVAAAAVALTAAALARLGRGVADITRSANTLTRSRERLEASGRRECRIVPCRDVTERNAESIELAVARDVAVEAARVRSAFLANMSHEIRTPMNGVIGMNELLLQTELDEDQRYLAEQVASSSDQMLAIIDDILEIATIEAGRLELHEADFDLVRLIGDGCRAAGAQAAAKGLRLERLIDDGLPRFVHGDATRLRRVLASLVSNAVKFTPAGSVAVRAGAAPGREAGSAAIRVEIADTGVGIERELLDRIFDPFVQADMTTTRCHGGAGLGLAIARSLIELMGGTIGARSEPGAGSTFWFELTLEVCPRLRPGYAPPPARDDAGRELHAATPLVLVGDDGPRAVVRHPANRFRGRRERRARGGRGTVSAQERWRAHIGERGAPLGGPAPT